MIVDDSAGIYTWRFATFSQKRQRLGQLLVSCPGGFNIGMNTSYPIDSL